MDFELSSEQKAVRQLARDFARKEILPVVPEIMAEGRFPRELIRRLGEVGFLGATFPEKYGGSELGFVMLALISEEIGKAMPVLGSAFNMNSMTVPFTILNWGTEEQIERYVPPLISGQKIGFFGLTEPDGGSDVVGAMKTRAVRDDSHYILNGGKVFITFLCEADYGVVFAKTDPELKHRGISAFIVPTNLPGVTRQKMKLSALGSTMATGELTLEDVRVPKENLLGEEGQGFTTAMNALDYGRLTVPARAVGLAQGCLEEALRYANERMAFGKRIGEFQMVQHSLADMVVEVDAARLLVWRSAYLKDRDLPSTRESSISKYYSSEVAMRAVRAAAEIFGGYAVSDEYPLSKYLNYTYLLLAGEGSPNIQRVLIAEDALGWKNANRHAIPRRFSLRSDLQELA